MLRERPLYRIGNPSDIAAYALAGVALLAVGYTVHAILSPFVVVATVVYLLYPLRSQEFVRRVIVASAALLALWGFSAVFSLLVPFLIAYVLAYLFDPLVSRLAARRIPRWGASLAIVLFMVGSLVTAGLFIAPIVGVHLESLLIGVQRLVESTTAWLGSDEPLRLLSRVGIPPDRARELVSTSIAPRLEGIVTAVVNGVIGLLIAVPVTALLLVVLEGREPGHAAGPQQVP